jgi:Na+/melibiose symporter-like transporter
VHFQLLLGTKLISRPRLYQPIYLSVIFLTSTIAFVIINIKKMKERYEEWKFHQNINVNLNEQQHNEGQLQFNNMKNNFPLLTGFQIALLVGFVLVGNVTFWFLEYTFNDSKYFYTQYLLKELALVFIYNIVMPLIYLIKKKKMRKYIWQYVSDLML